MIPAFIRSLSGTVKLLLHKSRTTSPIPGSKLYVAKEKQVHFEEQQYEHRLFRIGYRFVQFFKRFYLDIEETEKNIRLEAVLTGELPVVSYSGENILLQPGQYHLSVHPSVSALFKKDSACRYFVTHYSPELLAQIGVSELVQPCNAKPLSGDMQTIIQRILHHPFEDRLRDFHYDNSIRELLFLHLSTHNEGLPGTIAEKDVARIYAADAFLQQDLTIHTEIPELAKKAGINELKLKQGFRTVFNMGVFERLTHHRMEYAKVLLRTGNRTIDDIAGQVGYSSRNSFISGFKKKYDVTPGQWRAKQFD